MIHLLKFSLHSGLVPGQLTYYYRQSIECCTNFAQFSKLPSYSLQVELFYFLFIIIKRAWALHVERRGEFHRISNAKCIAWIETELKRKLGSLWLFLPECRKLVFAWVLNYMAVTRRNCVHEYRYIFCLDFLCLQMLQRSRDGN